MSSSRRSDFGIVAAIFVFAVLVSPIGIRFGTGRLDLSPRVNILSLTFDLFLMTLAGAVLTSGRARRVFLPPSGVDHSFGAVRGDRSGRNCNPSGRPNRTTRGHVDPRQQGQLAAAFDEPWA